MTDRTDEQHMADVAASALANLTNLHNDLGNLRVQLQFLSNWAAEQHPDLHRPLVAHHPTDLPDLRHHEFLGAAALMVGTLTIDGCVPDMVRDIAAKLPIRGLDYGEEASQ